jgi:protein involved in polysaccharide export with SLBB domain
MGGVNLEQILAGKAEADQVLQNGDLIDLPPRPGTIRVLGEVMVPGSLVFVENLSVRDVIARSGGLTRQADEDSVFVARADGSVVATAQGNAVAWDPDRRRWQRTSLRGIKLQEGDAILVPAYVRYVDSSRRIVRDWTQIMFQIAATVGTIALVAK